MQITTVVEPDFTTLELTGDASMEAFALRAAQAGEASRQRHDKCLLVNLTEVAGTLAFTEQFRLGKIAAAHFGHLEKLASVVPPDKITRTSEKVALSMGVQLRVFTSSVEAAAWLRS